MIEETAYLTAKLRALEQEIERVLTQEVLVKAGCPEGAASAEAGGRRSRQPQLSKSLICDQVEGNLRVEEKAEG